MEHNFQSKPQNHASVQFHQSSMSHYPMSISDFLHRFQISVRLWMILHPVHLLHSKHLPEPFVLHSVRLTTALLPYFHHCRRVLQNHHSLEIPPAQLPSYFPLQPRFPPDTHRRKMACSQDLHQKLSFHFPKMHLASPAKTEHLQLCPYYVCLMRKQAPASILNRRFALLPQKHVVLRQ